MEKFGGKVQTAALAALLAMGALALGLGGCKDAWRILTTGELYWEDDNGNDEEEGEEEEEKAVYAFRYDPSGGELYGGTPEGGIAEGETVTLPSSGGREGYTLTGFTLSGAAEGGFNPGDTFTMPAGEVTAKAEWTEAPVTIGSGRFIIAERERNTWSVSPYLDLDERAFHYLLDAEEVLDYTKWDQEAQGLYRWHLIDPLEYDTTAAGDYIAVRRFTDTGEMAEH